MSGDKGNEHETSAFVSQGQESFPPLYFDNEDVRNFSDERKWSTPVLMARLAMYLEFIAKEDTMPRARKVGQRVIDHVIFELQAREGVYLIETPASFDEADTIALDTNKLKEMLDEC